jgi:hypothetical protein
VVRPRRPAACEVGSSLLEALLSLVLSLLVLVMALPVLSWSRSLAADASRQALESEGAQLTALRLLRDVRRAGFGLTAGESALRIDPEDGRILLAFLDGGFHGGYAVIEPAPAGQTFLLLAAVGELREGDEVTLRDGWGRAFRTRVAEREAALLRVHLSDPLPFPALPEAGARLYRVRRREWRLDGDGLRRDGQPALDPPVGLAAATLGGVSWESGLRWVLANGEGERPPAGDEGLLAAVLAVGGPAITAGGVRGPGDVRPRRGARVPLLGHVRNRLRIRSSGSPLP